MLTGGGDRPYAIGIATALSFGGALVDLIGSDELKAPELLHDPRIRFLNLRGDQRSDASAITKLLRVILYYLRLFHYAVIAEPTLFHILWNNKFQFFDRTLLMLFYKTLRKTLFLTVHNVNIGERDANDCWANRLSLRTQYQLADHIFVHTEKMKKNLVSKFSIAPRKVSVIPFGINNTVPNTGLSTKEAKQALGLSSDDKTMLFFGNIAPYKGLEYLASAFIELAESDGTYSLLVAGRPKHRESYWQGIRERLYRSPVGNRVIQRIEYIPDGDTELYFKAADILVLPYTRVFQSGVLFLGYSFGLPAIVTNVGSLAEDVVEGETGFVTKGEDSHDLANTIRLYFESALFRELEDTRRRIQAYANERYSWRKVADITLKVYSGLLREDGHNCRDVSTETM